MFNSSNKEDSLDGTLMTENDQPYINSLNIFAHMDDDLGGMNPDIYYDIQNAGTSATVISNWFTGNTSGTDEAIKGAKVVYAYMADMPKSWTTEIIKM